MHAGQQARARVLNCILYVMAATQSATEMDGLKQEIYFLQVLHAGKLKSRSQQCHSDLKDAVQNAPLLFLLTLCKVFVPKNTSTHGFIFPVSLPITTQPLPWGLTSYSCKDTYCTRRRMTLCYFDYLYKDPIFKYGCIHKHKRSRLKYLSGHSSTHNSRKLGKPHLKSDQLLT